MALAMAGVTSWTVTPIQPRTTLPVFSMLLTMFMARLTGMANPMPTFVPDPERMAVFIPMSSPSVFTRAPPELPGLMGASVWMKFS